MAIRQSITQQELRNSAAHHISGYHSGESGKGSCQIDDALNGVVEPQMKAKVERVRKSWPEQLQEEYNHRERYLTERNSYSKTDNDATFMRMRRTT